MDIRQMSADNHWQGIWPGTCSLLGLYTRCVSISAKELKFWGGYSVKMATNCHRQGAYRFATIHD